MKRHLLLALFLIAVLISVFSFVSVKQAERFYYAFDEKIPLETVEGWYVIRYDSTPDTLAESALCNDLNKPHAPILYTYAFWEASFVYIVNQ